MAGFFVNSTSIMCSCIEHLREQYPCINPQDLWILLNHGMFADWTKVSMALSKRQGSGTRLYEMHCLTLVLFTLQLTTHCLFTNLMIYYDIIVIGNSDSFVNGIIQQLGSQHHKVCSCHNTKINLGVVLWTSMDNAKEIVTLMSTMAKLHIRDNSTPASMALSKNHWHASISRSHPSWHWLCSHQTISVYATADHNSLGCSEETIRYLKHTMFHGILLQKHDQFHLKTCNDADWASNANTRVSTTTFITFHFLTGSRIWWLTPTTYA